MKKGHVLKIIQPLIFTSSKVEGRSQHEVAVVPGLTLSMDDIDAAATMLRVRAVHKVQIGKEIHEVDTTAATSGSVDPSMLQKVAGFLQGVIQDSSQPAQA